MPAANVVDDTRSENDEHLGLSGDELDRRRDLVGYDVEATDGSIGKIDAATADADRAHVVVDTGWWIFGKKRLIPAGAITAVDHDEKRVVVQMTKDEIKSAPDFEADAWDAQQTEYERYYGPYGW